MTPMRSSTGCASCRRARSAMAAMWRTRSSSGSDPTPGGSPRWRLLLIRGPVAFTVRLARFSSEREDEGVDRSAPGDDELLADARAAFQRCDWVAAFEGYRLADCSGVAQCRRSRAGREGSRVGRRVGRKHRVPPARVRGLHRRWPGTPRRGLGHRSGLRQCQAQPFRGGVGLARTRRASARGVRAVLGAWPAGRTARDGGSRGHARRDGRGRAVRRGSADRSADPRRRSGRRGVGGEGHGIGASRPRAARVFVWSTSR